MVLGLHSVLQALTRPRDAVLVMRPGFPPLRKCVQESDRRVVDFDLTHEDGRYTLDPERLRGVLGEEHVRLVRACPEHLPNAPERLNHLPKRL